MGPFRLFVSGEEQVVTRPQVRAVLAVLAAAESWTTASELIDCLWPDRSVADASAALRTVVSRARAALGSSSDALESNGDHYRLSIDTDLAEFCTLLADHGPTPAVRVQQLEQALGLMRGAPFDGIFESDRVTQMVCDVERNRDRLLRELLNCSAVTGQLGRAIEVGRVLTEQVPEDESVAVVMSRCLALSGRKSEAIAVLNASRVALRSIGLVVGPAFQELETSILQGAVDLDVEHDVSHRPQVGEVLVGRDVELASLTSTVSRAVVLIEGEAGIGKSALVGALRDQLALGGRACVIATASMSPHRPVQVFTEIVAELLRLGAEPSRRHLPALSVLLPRRFDSANRPSSREALLDGVGDFVSAAAERSSATIVIDDAHHLDAASLLALRGVCEMARCRVVLAARPGHRARLLDAVGPDAEVIELQPLSQRACELLVAAALPDAPSEAAVTMHRRSGGNPLFLRMLLELAIEEAGPHEGLPVAVLVAVQRRLDALSRTAQRMLQLASVFGEQFASVHLAALVGRQCDDLERDLVVAEELGIVRSVDGAGKYEFGHALVAEAAYQLLGEGERVVLHDQAGRILEAAGEGPMSIWVHCREAALLDGWRALRVAAAAANQHLDSFDWDGALECAEWGLKIVAEVAPGALGPPHALMIAAARAKMALGRSGSHVLLVEAAEAAHAAGDDVAMTAATIEICNSGSVALTGADMGSVLGLVTSCLSREIGREQRINLCAAAARAFFYSEHGALGQDLYAEAFSQFATCSPRVQELILRNSEAGLCNPKDFAKAQRATALMGVASDQNGELRWLARWFEYRDALISGDGGRLAWAIRDIRSSAPQTERRHAFVTLGQTFDMAMQQSWAESTFAIIHGDLERAEQAANLALDTGLRQLEVRGDGFGSGWVTSSYGLLLLAIRRAQGRLAELVDVVETEAPLIPAWRVAIVVANLAAGNLDRARRELEIVVADRFALLVPDATWTAATFLLAQPVAELLDTSVAEQLYRLIEPYSDRMSYSGLCTFGPMHEALGVLADSLGWTEEATVHRKLAVDIIHRLRRDSAWAIEEPSTR